MATTYICQDCEARFSSMEQTISDHRNGLCPFCGSEDIKEEGEIENAETMCEAGETA